MRLRRTRSRDLWLVPVVVVTMSGLVFGPVSAHAEPVGADNGSGRVEIVASVAATFDCGGQTSVPTGECEALVVLFNSTNGSGWRYNTGWLSDPDPCRWHGVICAAGRVTGLLLDDNPLSGSIPVELGNLTDLIDLYLDINLLSGSIPVELGNLTNLTDLFLDTNLLSGPIPVELASLTNLDRFSLGINQLSGSIPVELGNLTNLTELSLDTNLLSGPIPVELASLTNLSGLGLADNLLSGPIPSELGNLIGLRVLFLHSNLLSGPIPAELGNLTGLVELGLGENLLSGPIPPELGNLTNLGLLDLGTNLLSGAVPTELMNLASLDVFALSGQSGCLVASAVVLSDWLSSFDPGWNDGCGPTFSDDDGNIFEPDIEWLAASGITKGCNPPINDLFCPTETVSRGQVAAFLHRALPALPEMRLAIDFTDDDDSIFEADIEWMYSRGITQGNTATTFNPTGAVTRGEMAAFLVRALKYTDDGGGDLFIDDDDSIFRGDVDRLGTAGVTRGCNPPTNDQFCPDGLVTRGQMAAFLHRALGA